MEEKSLKAEVLEQIEDVKEYAKKLNFKDIKSGNWFVNFIAYALRNYSEKVDHIYFRKKYPHIPVEAIIKKRIELASKYAALEGAISGAAYSGAIAATIGTKGGASPITLSASATSFVVDMLYTTRLQLVLAYDLSVLYGQPADINDPEDVFDLIKIAFGVKASEKLSGSVSKLSPEAVRVGVKKVITGGTLEWLKQLPVIGKYLLQRNIIKFSMPVVTIGLSSGMNFYFTKKIGNSAATTYKKRAIIKERGQYVWESNESSPSLLIELICAVVASDDMFQENEIRFLNELIKLAENESDEDFSSYLEKLKDRIEFNEDHITEKLRKENKKNQETLFEAACMAATIDRKIQKEEENLLTKISQSCDLDFDIKLLEK